MITGRDLWIRYGLAFAVPFVATLWLTPLASKLAHRLGILDHPQEHKFHNNVTPYLGGLAVAAGLLMVGAITASSSGELLTIVVGGLALMIVGLEDDRRAVGPVLKILVEVAAGVSLWMAGVRAGFFDIYALDLAVTVLWVVAVTNAANLLDHMDGLLSGTAAIAALAFFAIAVSQGLILVASLALALAGASFGFLRHNFPPARIFLGDAGSLMIGFLLAALALKLDLVGESGFVRGMIPVLILGVPLFDTLLVIVARLRDGRPIYRGGTDHSSHRLVAAGMSGRDVALGVYAVQLVLSVIALLLLYATNTAALAVTLGVAAVCIAALAALLTLTGTSTPEAEQAAGLADGS
ncbi:MAG: MraY family glycosyltransferase [Actinomycetota bacterium]